jgi:uncharacterized protein DUF4038/uncharacterized protein DUF5060
MISGANAGGWSGVRLEFLACVCACILWTACKTPTPLHVSFSQSTDAVDAYDFVEVNANITWPHARNPFTDAALSGWFQAKGDNRKWRVDGFCDSNDGSVFRIRFMPPAPGDYLYSVEYRQGSSTSTSTGAFHASDGRRHGPIRVDAQHPWHFVWEGTGEHYFFNGTTAYWLMGWSDDKVIQSSIQRLHDLSINRMRVTIAGRTGVFYGEPVMVGRASPIAPQWTVFLTAWPAKQPEDIYHPGFDYTRFELSHWQKLDRALRFARDKDMVISLVLDMNDGRVHPEAGSEDEQRFLRYAVARFSAFSNISWDLGDDLDLFRDVAWTRQTGSLIKDLDPYKHLATSHPVNNVHQDRTAQWFDFTSFQDWNREQHAFMLNEREKQKRLGRIIPQTNEEYGYEDHYPVWAPKPDADSADTLRRMAWEIVMAGGYQTTGETARRGTNIWPDTGGGWMNGRGDATMTMLQGYAHMVEFMTSFEWWKTDPHDELVTRGNFCLAEPGQTYAVYLSHGGSVVIQLQPGSYNVVRFDPISGERLALPAATGRVWTSPALPSSSDWVFLLQKK